MKRLKTSTWVLIALVVVRVGLGTTLFVLGPEELPFRAGHAPFWGRGEKLELMEKELGKNIEELSLEEFPINTCHLFR